jgi:SAM-dependent methyltransferase
MSSSKFDTLIQQALDHSFTGWDFSWLRGRWHEANPSWDYAELVQEKIKAADLLLDMGTGGGEFLASVPTLPKITYATESYPPNIAVAQERLSPLGVRVVTMENDSALPLPSEFFDLVINRHESYDLGEVFRILKPGGIFLTQQVGPHECIQLNQYLEAPLDSDAAVWTLEQEAQAMKSAGFHLHRCEEQLVDSIFYDIGAVVYFLKIIEWQIPDFSVEAYRERLLALHHLIERQGAFFTTAHRCLLEAQKK